jgi:signal transduction histidine kinase
LRFQAFSFLDSHWVDCMQIPIRIRLSISYFVIFAVAGILLCVASYLMARKSLYTALDHEFEERVDDVHDFFQANGLGNDLSRERALVTAEFDLKDEGKWLQIADEQGRWIYRARRMMIAPHDLPPASALPAKGSVLVFGVDDKQIRSLRRAFTLNGHTFVVETGSTLTKTDQTLLLYRHGLFLISPVIFLMAGLAGHLVSRNALAPVAAIAREAQRIHDGTLQTRLPQLGTRDELAHLSRTLNEMLERIESGMRSVRDFTAYASHELRTPLALIRTEADLALQKERSGAEYREAIAIIGAEAQRMSSLLDSLLFLARTDAGAERVQMCAVDGRQLCVEMHEKLRLGFERAQIRFKADLPASAVRVMADPVYLQRLLMIVLENAAKYTPAGGQVQLLLQRDGDRARFEIVDSGIGIPEGDRAHIFERFRRGSNARETHVHGSGLGLALAAWIAKSHETRIEVKSVTGFGSSFSWTLALAAEETDQDSAAEMESRLGQLPAASIYP